VLIVTAPLWFKAPFKILRLFVREKLRERVFTVSVPQLALHVPRKALPIHLGGTLEVDHATWLLSCRQSMTNREDELLANIVGVAGSGSATGSAAVATNGTESAEAATTGATIISAVHLLGDNNTTVVTVSNGVGPAGGAASAAASAESCSSEPNENITINGLSPSHRQASNSSSSGSSNATAANPLKLNTSGSAENNSTTAAATVAGAAGATGGTTTTNGGGEFWSENPPSSASSGFSDDDSLAGQEGDPKPIDQIVQMVKQRGRHGLIKEYADIRNRAPEGTFLHAR